MTAATLDAYGINVEDMIKQSLIDLSSEEHSSSEEVEYILEQSKLL